MIEFPNFEAEVPWETLENKILSTVQQLVDACIEDMGDIEDFIYSNRHCLKENILDNDFYLDDGECIKKGTKITKALWHFKHSESIIRYLQDKYSEIIQKNKLKGTLVISIHPLDYLTVSENNHNWRSCHALDGDYRAGNLNYMADDSTVVCYIKDPEDVQLDNFPPGLLWNNKKWRMLLFFSQNRSIVMAGRQYPYDCGESILTKITELLAEKKIFWSQDWGSPWFNDYVTETERQSAYEKVFIARNEWYILNDFIKNRPHTHQFNDLLYSSTYTKPYFNFTKWYPHQEADKLPTMRIGMPVKCVCCEEDFICNSDSFLCIDCEEEFGTSEEGFCICDHCGRRVFEGRVNYIELNGIWTFLCNDCYQEIVEKENVNGSERNRSKESSYENDSGSLWE